MNAAVSYDEAYADWQRDPQAWWANIAEGITWTKRWDRVFDPSLGAYGQWFAGGMLNTCYNCVDRHVEAGRGAQPALIWDSAMTGKVVTHTYAELRDRTAKLAGALANLGVGPGDRVVIYMPMVPEAAIAMLACARLGAIHSVVFGGFAAPELATRIDDAAWSWRVRRGTGSPASAGASSSRTSPCRSRRCTRSRCAWSRAGRPSSAASGTSPRTSTSTSSPRPSSSSAPPPAR